MDQQTMLSEYWSCSSRVDGFKTKKIKLAPHESHVIKIERHSGMFKPESIDKIPKYSNVGFVFNGYRGPTIRPAPA